ncbi:MAG: carboxylesterase family protein [Steroidobacteraceae bacterium]
MPGHKVLTNGALRGGKSQATSRAGRVARLALFLAASVVVGTQMTTASERHMPIPIKTTAGLLQGIEYRGATAYLGVPFAAAPVGELRWRAPRRPPHWQGVRLADRFGNSCMQDAVEFDIAGQKTLGEDCLYLNVWTPAATPSAKMPVMVWLHGGAFAHASGAHPSSDGAHLAARGVMVVTVNYRLGRFGFFAHPALTQEEPAAPLANYGLLDQIAALEWVKENAAAFGGDPSNVTVFGQSAGGVSICYLLAAPLAKGLFHRAIIESGVFFTGPPGLPRTLQDAETVGTAAAKSWGLEATNAAALRKVPAETILAGSPGTSWPVIDGKVVTGDLRLAFDSGQIAHVPVLLGTNSYEVGWPQLSAWSQGLSKRLSAQWPAVTPLYSGFGTHRTDLIEGQLATDMSFTVPTRYAARAAARHGLPTYLYVYSYLRPSQSAHLPGPVHMDEIYAVFGNMDQVESHPDAGTQRVIDEVQSRWVQFAKTGQPTESAPQWPALTPNSEGLVEFTTNGPVVRVDYERARIDLAETLAAAPPPR